MNQIRRREGLRRAVDVITVHTPSNFSNTRSPYEYDHDNTVDLRYAFEEDHYYMEGVDGIQSLTDRETCAAAFVRYMGMQTNTIRRRMQLKLPRTYFTVWDRVLTKDFIEWAFSPSNQLKLSGNTSAHLMTYAEVCSAMTEMQRSLGTASEAVYLRGLAELSGVAGLLPELRWLFLPLCCTASSSTTAVLIVYYCVYFFTCLQN